MLAQPLSNDQDVVTLALMLLATDRAAPMPHYGLQPIERRGCWIDTYLGAFGSLFWLGTEKNFWGSGSKLAQVQRWAEQALQPLYTQNLVLQPVTVTTFFRDNESIQIDIDLLRTDGTTRTINYIPGTN